MPNVKIYTGQVQPKNIGLNTYQSDSVFIRTYNVVCYVGVGKDVIVRPFGLLETISAYFGILKYWTGSIWERALLKVFDSGFTTKPLKYYDGADWLEIDTTG